MTTDGEEPPLAALRFEAEVIHWRGPSPYFFAVIPPQHTDELRAVSRMVTYGWGMTPVEAQVAGFAFTTSLYPRKGQGYLLPLKDAVRHATGVTAGDRIAVEMIIRAPR